MSDFDVVVIGGGIAGVSVAYELSGTHRVAVVEAEAHLAFHSTGRSELPGIQSGKFVGLTR